MKQSSEWLCSDYVTLQLFYHVHVLCIARDKLYYYMLYCFVEAVAMSYNLLCKTVDINELVVTCG